MDREPRKQTAGGDRNRCHRKIWIALISLLVLTAAHAVERPKEILLSPNGAPGSEGKTGEMKVRIAEGSEVAPMFLVCGYNDRCVALLDNLPTFVTLAA